MQLIILRVQKERMEKSIFQMTENIQCYMDLTPQKINNIKMS